MNHLPMINTSIYDGVGKAKQQFSIDLHCSVNGNCQNDQYIDSVQEMIIFHISLSRLSQMSGERDEILRQQQQNKKLLHVVVGVRQDCCGDGRVLLSIKDNLGISIIFSNCVKSRHMERG